MQEKGRQIVTEPQYMRLIKKKTKAMVDSNIYYNKRNIRGLNYEKSNIQKDKSREASIRYIVFLIEIKFDQKRKQNEIEHVDLTSKSKHRDAQSNMQITNSF